jgi:lysophospholipase L1-like esterase
VALGDSYAAGLDIPEQTGATAGCGQSSSSYPFLVARGLRLKLTDMSCSSATIASLTAAEPTGDGINPAQLSALSAGTALVTLGIGGNDVGWVQIITRCTEMDLVPALTSGDSPSERTPCRDYYTSGGTNQIQQRIQSVAGQLREALTRISQRAPRARVYVVGYPDLLPPSGGACGDTLGITEGDIAFLNNEELRLNGMLRQVARAAGAGYVDTYAPSEGHDACAAPASRWIEPLIPDAPAAPLHPNAVGEEGMADAIVGAINLAGDELVDVAIGPPEVLPRRSWLAQKLDACRSQLVHGRGQVADREADNRACGEMLFAWIAAAENLDMPPVRKLEDPEICFRVHRPEAKNMLVEMREFTAAARSRAAPSKARDLHACQYDHAQGRAPDVGLTGSSLIAGD